MKELKLAMLGMVDGNGHPYSWSAIFNGYNKEEMDKCPYAGIPDYLYKEPYENLCIPGAKVTHVWTDDPEDAIKVAKASLIPNIVKNPEDVIGKVDAVIIATDKGHEHVKRAKPFIEANIPVFIDKPLVDNKEDLDQFIAWVNEGKAIMSSSCMRYVKEFIPYRISTSDIGELRFVSMTMAKTWERYGIHALEGVYPIIGSGIVSVRNTGNVERNILHIKNDKNVDIVIANIKDMVGAFAKLGLYGTKGSIQTEMRDTFYAFKTQLEGFVQYLRTGQRPFPFEETIELMKVIIAGIKSREEGGIEIFIKDI